MKESNDFQAAWTEYSEEDFYRDIDIDRDTVPSPMKLVVPRFLKRLVGKA